MSSQVLGKYLEEFAVVGLLLTFIYVMIAKTISATGIFAAVFAGLTLKNHGQNIEPKAYLTLKMAAIVALVSMALIIIKVFVLSSRYAAGLSWVLISLAAFYFATLLVSKDKKNALIASLIVVVLCLGFMKNVLPKRQGYNYAQDAVVWVEANNLTKQAVFYDDSRIRYYAKQEFIRKSISNLAELEMAYNNKTIYDYPLLAISSTNKNAKSELFMAKNLPQYQQIKRFSSYKKDKHLVIYAHTTHYLSNNGD